MSNESPKFNVTLLQPSGYIHSLALSEAAEYVHGLLLDCGYASRLSTNDLRDDEHNVLFCAHLLQEDQLPKLPKSTIIFNSEQIENASGWYFQGGVYGQLLDSHHVWDYSQNNLHRIGHDRKSYVPFLYSPRLIRTGYERRTDGRLLFYGSITRHRQKLLGELAASGVSVEVLFGQYGEARDQKMFHAWAILNLHNSEDVTTFEPIRCFYPLINGIPVISESSPADSTAEEFRDAVFFYPPDRLARYVSYLASHQQAFHAEAMIKQARFRGGSAVEHMRVAVGRYLQEQVNLSA